MERRKFIGTAAAGSAAFAIPKWLLGQSCEPTTRDLYGYGPYYLENAPERNRIASPSEPGQPLSIAGTVKDCNGPVEAAVIEVWQATDAGCYIHPWQASCPDGGNPEISSLWGTLISDAKGHYSFDTILPGKYLNGESYRPRHIHFRIRTPEGWASSADLVTQLYFEGDPDIPGDLAASDPGAASRIIPLSNQGNSRLTGTFDITLPDQTSGLNDPALPAFDVAVHRMEGVLSLHIPALPRDESVEMLLRNADGRLLGRSTHEMTPIALQADRIPLSGCLAELTWNGRRGSRRERVWLRK